MFARNRFIQNYFFMVILAIIVGVIGITLQFFPGYDSLAFVMVVIALAGLLGGSHHFSGQKLQYTRRYFKIAFDWLIAVILTGYTIVILSEWVAIFEETTRFLNEHWAGLIASLACIVLGVLALFKENAPESE